MKFTTWDSTGVAQDFELKDGDKKGDVVIISRRRENVSDIIEENKRQAREEGRQTLGRGTQTSMYKLGSLSQLQTFNLIKQGIFYDDNKLRRWMGDLDNYLWRVLDKPRRGGISAIQSLQDLGRQPELDLRASDSERRVLPHHGYDVREPSATDKSQ